MENSLRRIVRECTPKNDLASLNVENLRKVLGDKLDEKKFLLVLDDAWNENWVKWLKLDGCLRNGAKGSKILLTTRYPHVAKTMTSHFMN